MNKILTREWFEAYYLSLSAADKSAFAVMAQYPGSFSIDVLLGVGAAKPSLLLEFVARLKQTQILEPCSAKEAGQMRFANESHRCYVQQVTAPEQVRAIIKSCLDYLEEDITPDRTHQLAIRRLYEQMQVITAVLERIDSSPAGAEPAAAAVLDPDIEGLPAAPPDIEKKSEAPAGSVSPATLGRVPEPSQVESVKKPQASPHKADPVLAQRSAAGAARNQLRARDEVSGPVRELILAANRDPKYLDQKQRHQELRALYQDALAEGRNFSAANLLLLEVFWHWDNDELDSAGAVLYQLCQMVQKSGDRTLSALVLHKTIELFLLLGEFERLLSIYEYIIDDYEEVLFAGGADSFAFGLAMAYHRAGFSGRAAGLALAGIEIAKDNDEQMLAVLGETVLAEIKLLSDLGSDAGLKEQVSQLAMYAQEQGNLPLQGRLLVVLAELCYRRGDLARARSVLAEVSIIFRTHPGTYLDYAVFPELLFKLQRAGQENVPGFAPAPYIKRMHATSNHFAQGVAARILAQQQIYKGSKDHDTVIRLLEESEQSFGHCGASCELAHTKSILSAYLLEQLANKEAATEKALEILHLAGDYRRFLTSAVRELIGDRLTELPLLGKLVEIGQSIVGRVEPGRLCGVLIGRILKLLNAERAALFLLEEETELNMTGLRGYSTERFTTYMDGWVGELIEDVAQKEVVISILMQDDAARAKYRISGSLGDVVALPLMFSGNLYGVLLLENRHIACELAQADPSMLYAFGCQIAVVMHNMYTISEMASVHKGESSQLSFWSEYATGQIYAPEQLIYQHDKQHNRRMVKVVDSALANAKLPAAKPLIICGAKGVGKRALARYLAQLAGVTRPLVELELSRAGGHSALLTRAVEAVGEWGMINLVDLDRLELPAQKLLYALIKEYTGKVAFVATTSRSLTKAVKKGLFIGDLYQLFSEQVVKFPLLCERSGDIPRLAEYFISKFAHGRNLRLEESERERLVAYSWPGNVWELQAVIEKAVLYSTGTKLCLPALRVKGSELDKQALPATLDRLAGYKVQPKTFSALRKIRDKIKAEVRLGEKKEV